jgi:hypothetical protein
MNEDPQTLVGDKVISERYFTFTVVHINQVIYYAQAKIDVVFKHDLKSKVPFVINAKFEKLLEPSHGQNSKTFFFTPGTLSAKVILDKNVYFPGRLYCI